ncbi:unnamed protein product [Musa textilis]
MYDFELFRMEPSKTIDDMYTNFIDVVNNLRALGKFFSDFELINKILRSLPKRWDLKITAIQESKDLNFYSLEELIGSLITDEIGYTKVWNFKQKSTTSVITQVTMTMMTLDSSLLNLISSLNKN